MSHRARDIMESERSTIAEVTHTPGPWHAAIEVRGADSQIIGPQGLIAEVYGCYPWGAANARLIAAAPALLAALRKIAAGTMPGLEEQAGTRLVSWMRGIAIEAIDGLTR